MINRRPRIQPSPEKPRYVIAYGEQFALFGAARVQAAVGQVGEASVLLNHNAQRTFAQRTATLRHVGATGLIVVTERGFMGPAFAGPQSYTAAAEMLRVTRDDMYTEPSVHLEIERPLGATEQELVGRDANLADRLVFSPLSEGDPAANMIKMIQEYSYGY